MGIMEKIKECKTMPEFDSLRIEVVKAMKAAGPSGYQVIQKAFIKQKNKLKRIPLRDRNW